MPSRKITVDGTAWEVLPSGHVTQYDGDEFGLVFLRGSGSSRELRVTRYRPTATRGREQAKKAILKLAADGVPEAVAAVQRLRLAP